MHDAVQRRHAAAPCGAMRAVPRQRRGGAFVQRPCPLPPARRAPSGLVTIVAHATLTPLVPSSCASACMGASRRGAPSRSPLFAPPPAALEPAAGPPSRSGRWPAMTARGPVGGGRLLLLLVPQLQITIWGALAHMTTFPAPGADHWQCLNAKQGIANTKLAACASPHPLQTPANAFATARPDRDARQPWRAASSAEVPSAPPWPSTWRARGTRRCCGRARRRCVWGVLHQRPPARASGIAPQAAVR